MPWDGLTHPAFKFGEVTTYTLDVPMYMSHFTHGINKDTYNSMSAAQKKVVELRTARRNGRGSSTRIGTRTAPSVKPMSANPTAS